MTPHPQTLLRRLLNTVLPPMCEVCGTRLSPSEGGLCAACVMRLPRTGFALHPEDNDLAHLFWGRVDVERAASLVYYRPKSDTARLILSLKYDHKPTLCAELGRAMAAEFAAHGFFSGIDAIVPVPLTRMRRLQRGYNQSERIAQGVSSITGIPVETRAVRRTVFSTSQTQLDRWRRMDNVDGKFALADGAQSLAGKHILIVDDIITTGATVAACASALNVLPGVRISVASLGFTCS